MSPVRHGGIGRCPFEGLPIDPEHPQGGAYTNLVREENLGQRFQKVPQASWRPVANIDWDAEIVTNVASLPEGDRVLVP